uniref:Uncharacterized protein KIAA1143 homolog n=1 Tax=Phallusia mammillata TaxID=59560 RepID=A0A6F9DF12_9ASCI|nr:uncharacterized protein KIAA1143 homolog [Phallusia mammillata]
MSNKLRFIKQEQPKFIQQFKQRVGLKHEPSLEDKVCHVKQQSSSVKLKPYLQVQAETPDLEDLPEKDDEKPVVVVLKQGDLTAEEAAKEDIDEVPADGKIKFRKPTASKRTTNSPVLSASSKRKVNSDEVKKDESDVKAKKKKKTSNKSKALLSFDDEDECD